MTGAPSTSPSDLVARVLAGSGRRGRRWVTAAAGICAGATLIAGASARMATLPQQIGKVDLLTQANVRIDGAAPEDEAGLKVAAAGDVNGDGIGDVIVAAPFAANEGRQLSGSAYVVFGRRSPGTVDLASLGGNGFRIDGATYSNHPYPLSVAGAGDVNGDGLADVIVGFPGDGNNGRAVSGSAYVVFGKRSTSTVDLANLGSGGFRIDGAQAGDETGFSVAGNGDVNGDGLADVIVGAPFANNNAPQFKDSGAAYVVYGKKTTTPIDLGNYGAFRAGEGLRIDGGFAGQTVGWSVAGVGDVNGDGRPDVVVGAPYFDVPTQVGSAYVIYGTAATGTIDTGAFTPTLGYQSEGIAPRDGTGKAVAGAGDVNGDGRPDILVGAGDLKSTGNGSLASVYVVFGKTSTDPVALGALGAGGFRIAGAVVSIDGPPPFAGAGDVNGDGLADVIVGSPNTDENGRLGSGTVYVVFGKASTSTVDLTALGTAGIQVEGAAASDGLSVGSAAGDFNGDGRPDVIVGAGYASNNDRTLSGAAYVLYGFGAPALAYDPLTATAGVKIAPHAPTRLKRTGEPSFAVAPSLPAGLVLDAKTGVVTGTPALGQRQTTYTVTMTDLAGQVQALLSIEVRDVTPPRLVLGGASVQRVLAQKGVLVKASCDEACTLAAGGSVTVLRTKLRLALRPARATLASAGSRTLKVSLPTHALTRLATLLKAGKHARAVLTVRATDRFGNTSSSTRLIKVRR